MFFLRLEPGRCSPPPPATLGESRRINGQPGNRVRLIYNIYPHVIVPRCLLLVAADYIFDLWRSRSPFILGSFRGGCVPVGSGWILYSPTRQHGAWNSYTGHETPSQHLRWARDTSKTIRLSHQGHHGQQFLVGRPRLMLLLYPGPRPSQPPIIAYRIMDTIICAEQQQHQQRSCAMGQGVKVYFAAIMSADDSNNNNNNNNNSCRK